MIKKIIRFAVFLSLLFIPSICSNASTYVDSFDDHAGWLDAYVIKEKAGIKKYQQMTYMIRKSDGQFIYCIEPGIPVDSSKIMQGYIENQAYIANISETEWERISLLAYYGYGYKDHTDIKWYIITQYMIWKSVPNGYEIYFTDTLNGNRITRFSEEIEEMERLISEHNVLPSFNGVNKSANVNEVVTLTDTNHVLDKFDVYSSSDGNVQINNYDLKVSSAKVQNVSISLEKKDKNLSEPTIVYVDPVSQDVIVRGSYKPLLASVNVNFLGGDITVHKKDKDTLTNTSMLDLTLKGAVYGIYDVNNNKITTVTTDEYGNAKSSILPSLGQYYLIEEVAPLGYELDKTKYYFEISENNLHPEIEVFDTVIKAEVKITKVLVSNVSNSDILEREANVKFGVYDKNGNLYTEKTTDSNGELSLVLPYGEWEIKQLSTTIGYKKAKPFKVNIQNNNKQEFLLKDEEVSAKLKVIKIDEATKEVVKLAHIKFRIKNLSTNEYVSQTLTYPTISKIDVFETDENGILVTPYPLGHGKYSLEEVNEKMNGYLWNSEPVQFEINEHTVIEDGTLGVIVEVKFENKQVTGEIELTKVGEKLVINNEDYHYEEIPLDNVKFELHANNDIYVGGVLKYQKDELVKILEIKDGQASVNNLPLGDYYLIEVETSSNHILDKEKYEFSLEYIDQNTPVVKKSIELKNYLPKGKLIFTKRDILTKNPIEGTLINVYYEDGSLIYSGRTSVNGEIILNDLPLGKYLIKEKEASEGYQATNEFLMVEFTENNQVESVEMLNNLIVKVPDTGYEFARLDLVFASIILSILTFTLKNENN